MRMITTIMMMTMIIMSTNVSMMRKRMERDIQSGFNLVLSRLVDEDEKYVFMMLIMMMIRLLVIITMMIIMRIMMIM